MDGWIQGVMGVLRRVPAHTLPLTELAAELRREGVFVDPRDPWFRTTLEEATESLQLIPVPRGPWGLEEGGVRGDPWGLDEVLGRGPGKGAGSAGDLDPASELGKVWVLLKNPSETGPAPGWSAVSAPDARTLIYDGVSAWAGALDAGSPASVARWIHAAREGGRACAALGGLPERAPRSLSR